MTKIEKPEVEWNQKSLAALRPGPVTWTFSDSTTPGLTLRVTKGGAKTYFYTYRMGGRGTKFHWLKLADFKDLPLGRARELAREYRNQRDKGIDPAQALLEAAHRGSTLDQVLDRFELEYMPKELKPKSQLDYADSIRVHIRPKLGKIPIKDLSRDQVAKWHAGIPSRDGRGEVAANRALAVLSCVCTQAELWGLRTEGANPCKHVTRFQEEPRVRDVQVDELVSLGKALKALEGRLSPWALGAVKVAALCAGRVSEVLALRRDRDTHLAEGYALVRDHKSSRKSGAKYLELPPAAVKILEDLPEQRDNPWYFPGRHKGMPLTRSGLRATWLAVCDQAEASDIHIHDLRSFFASEGQDQEIPDKIVSTLLGHSDTRTTQKHYAKVRRKSSASAAARISAPVAQAFGLEEDPVQARARRLVKRAIRRLKDR